MKVEFLIAFDNYTWETVLAVIPDGLSKQEGIQWYKEQHNLNAVPNEAGVRYVGVLES
jgi:hypothetical protein